MLQTIIDEISTNFNGLDYLGLANTYKGKNYIDTKEILWEDNKGDYFYIVNRQINFKKSNTKFGIEPVYEFDLYLYTQVNNQSVLPYYLINNLPHLLTIGTIKFEEVKKGMACIIKCLYQDNSSCNETNLCLKEC